MRETLPKFDVVVLGVGHTNAHVLRMWRMQPPDDARLTCISDFGVATYSGMLPGTLAGQYGPEEMHIDLVRLCAAAGARLILGEVTGLDVTAGRLHLADRPPLPYDVLSIGIGSRPAIPADGGELGLAIKPMQTFLDRLDARVDELIAKMPDRPLRIVIVGGGAGGVEIAFCLPVRVAERHPGVPLKVTLVDRDEQILAGMPSRTGRLALDALRRREVQVLSGKEVVRVAGDGRLRFADESDLSCDLAIWATSASRPPLVERLGLATDDRGFLLTRDTLQSVTSDAIFAVGDTATVVDRPRPKAGVFAVRQGPVVWRNLRRQLHGGPLESWRPQRSFLSLLNTGDGRAILTYKGQGIHAGWCWRLKDWIDRRFMAKYQDYTPMTTSAPPVDAVPMYCGGCGCKLHGDILSRVLARLDNPAPPHVLVGLEQPDDVAVVRTTPGRVVAASTDFFPAFLDDPYVLGRIAALNALSDVFAKGAQPLGALAVITVPHGPARQQEDFLSQLLAGSMHEFRPLDVSLIGGHTTEGPQPIAGFTILAEVESPLPTAKGRLRAGDQLALTKPLGTGVLLAGHMRALCRHDWMESLLDSMLTSNRPAAGLALQQNIAAVTDVTGFGLAGHLLEMLRAAGVSAEIDLAQIPLLPGTAELIAAGVESTMAPGNRALAANVDCPPPLREDPRFAALFDPQTSGGLLIGVPQSHALAGTVIGRVIESGGGEPTVFVRDERLAAACDTADATTKMTN